MMKYKYLLLTFMVILFSSCNNNVEMNSDSEDVSLTVSESIPTIDSTVEPTVEITPSPTVEPTVEITPEPTVEPTVIDLLSDFDKENLSISGYAARGIKDFSCYVDTSSYVKVSTAEDFIKAINDAKYEYETLWDESTNTYSQNLIKEGSVKVIELTNDINLGYYTLSSEAKSYTSVVSDYASKYNSLKDYLYFSDMFLENGMSQIKIERTSNLMIYSKNKAKITHAGFKLTSCDNIVFRNVEFDELWQWEDGISKDASKIGDYDAFGWSYFKIGFCGYIWIDHCKFGKSYDGQIDYANADYHSTKATSFRAPYGATSNKGISITWCDFASGSDDENGYIYQMMNKLEQDYLNDNCKALYYKALRDKGISFEEILYGLATPQKKGFLIGDDQDYKEDDHIEYDYNLQLSVTFANCRFIDLEDRLPKVRGGNIYMHNCLIDSSNYSIYREKLSSYNAANAVRSVNSSWKCALVSQGIVCGQGGSVKAENCIFKGIKTLLKNNDSGSIVPYNYGGYDLENCRYIYENVDYTGSSSDENHKFKNSNPTTLATKYFKWNTIDGNKPYEFNTLIDLDNLDETLSNELYGVGVNESLKDYWLTFNY